MKTLSKILLLAPAAAVLSIADAPPRMPAPYVQLVPEAQAIFGARRRTFRRTAIIVGSSVHAADSAQIAAAQQQAAAAQQQAAAAEKEAAAAKQQAAAATPPAPRAAAGQPLPLGTVVAALPSGCTSTPVGGVEYYYCGGNFYRAVFQGNKLVYVSAKP